MSPRRYRTTLREEAYLRRHWPLLRELRAALRTEPNVRLAVLFGSFAIGEATERSDLDLLVALDDAGAARVAELAGRLERRLGRTIQIAREQDASESGTLMMDVLEHGRVLVDRDDRWRELNANASRWRSLAAAEEVDLTVAARELEAE